MKILKLSLLTRIVNSAKDAKKYIFYINIGIFLSIFAISAASISFYIENKIDRIEFDLIQYQYDEKDNQNTLKELSVFNNIVQANLTSSKKIQNLYEHIASMGLGEYTISPEDIYLPSVYVQMTSNDNQNFIEMIEDGSFDEILKLFKELPINQEWKKLQARKVLMFLDLKDLLTKLRILLYLRKILLICIKIYLIMIFQN